MLYYAATVCPLGVVASPSPEAPILLSPGLAGVSWQGGWFFINCLRIPQQWYYSCCKFPHRGSACISWNFVYPFVTTKVSWILGKLELRAGNEAQKRSLCVCLLICFLPKASFFLVSYVNARAKIETIVHICRGDPPLTGGHGCNRSSSTLHYKRQDTDSQGAPPYEVKCPWMCLILTSPTEMMISLLRTSGNEGRGRFTFRGRK